MKEIFLKKLQICMKTYDYNDETKDVRGKVRTLLLTFKSERINAISELQSLL